VTTPAPLLVVGNAVLDIVLGVDHFPQEDEEMRAVSRRRDLGGNAANTARVLAALGHPVTLLATLASDGDAEELRRLLAEAGVNPDHLVTAGSGQTPVSHILVHQANGSRTIVHHRALAELALGDFRTLPLDRFGWVHFEGRNVEAVASMMDHLHGIGFGGGVSVEIEKVRPGIEDLASRSDLVLTCRAYAEAKALPDAPTLLSALRSHAAKAVITCTWGEAGAWASQPDGPLHHCPAFKPPRVVDTVGAGDVFNAGMIHALATGADTARALETATRLAGRKVGISGFNLGYPGNP
jgi:ketohexokinase